MIYIEAVVGLCMLLGAGDLLVRGSVTVARAFRVPTLFIGLTVVAFGTSAPELVVGIDAAILGVPKLALGNVVGSNIANILLVLGIPAMLRPITCGSPGFRRQAWLVVAAGVLFIALCWGQPLGSWQGLVLLILFAAFLVYSGRHMRRHPVLPGDQAETVGKVPATRGMGTLLVVAGLAGLALGSHLLIKGSVGIAQAFQVSEAVIGLTLIAIGTSLPELATGIAAVYRKQGDVVIGNVIGSNIFNILGVMGATATITPVPVPDVFLRFDLWVMLAASLLLLPLAYRGGGIGRVGGAGFLFAYGLYIITLIQ